MGRGERRGPRDSGRPRDRESAMVVFPSGGLWIAFNPLVLKQGIGSSSLPGQGPERGFDEPTR